MQKSDEILLTITVIVLLLTVILTVLLWQAKYRREKMRKREALTELLNRENTEMAERLWQKGIDIPETIKINEATDEIKTEEEIWTSQ